MSEFIQTAVTDRIQTIRINRPDKKNALDLAMYTALAEAVRGADANPDIRVSMITGIGDSFCSGNDINDFLKNPPADDSSPVLQFVEAMIHAEKPIIAAVNGIAIGIGTTMLLHCDLVYAADSARFQMPFVNIGLCPEAGSTYLLPLMMGHHRASEMLLIGNPFGPNDAVLAGIANAVVPLSQLESTAHEAAEKIAAQPPHALKVTKGLLRQSARDAVVAASRRESENFIAMLIGPEAKEALSAFVEKRKPDFSGF